MEELMQQQANMITHSSVGPPGIGIVTSRNPEVSRMKQVTHTTTEDFSPDSLVETEFGFAEGYYRRFFETPMLIEWNCGETVLGKNGIWEREKKFSYLPWPTLKDDQMPMPEWMNDLLHRLVEVERYLFGMKSVVHNNADAMCCLCDYAIDYSKNYDFVLSLDAFEPPTELRWSVLLKHYFTAHRALPSRMFAMVILERKL